MHATRILEPALSVGMLGFGFHPKPFQVALLSDDLAVFLEPAKW
jgi:hypothetical protein